MMMSPKSAMLAALLAAATVVAAPVAAQPAPAPASEDATKMALATRIVALAFPEDQRIAMFSGAMDNIYAQMKPSVDQVGDKEAAAITERHINAMRTDIMDDLKANSGGLFDALAKAYARAFTLQQLQDIERFVATPSGAAYVQRSAEILGDPAVAEWNKAYFQRMMAMIETRKLALIDELTDHRVKTTQP